MNEFYEHWYDILTGSLPVKCNPSICVGKVYIRILMVFRGFCNVLAAVP